MLAKKIPGTLAVLFALVLIVSCHTFYKARTVNTDAAATSIDSLKRTNRFFILRNGDEAYAMTDMVLSSDQRSMACNLNSLPSNHSLHLNNGEKGKMIYKRTKVNEAEVINEVHFYMTHQNNVAPGSYNLSLDKIFKIEVLEHDKKRTTNSYVIGTICTVLGAIVVVGLIAVAVKSSCPFISAYDGKDFSLQGEVYGGAIYPQLIRKDYLPLKMAPMTDGSLQIKITNELKEKQYTDFTRLWKISHPQNSRVFVDQEGKLHCVAAPQQPIEAKLDNAKDVLPALLKAGDYNQVYMDDSSRADAINDLVLRFKRPAAATKAKLVLSLKNSYWLDLLYGELAKGFGTYYATYMGQQKKKTAPELLKWVNEQHLPLTITINTGNGWQPVTQLTTVGPVAFRETAVSIDLPLSSADHFEIKLSSGFMFWEIDYAAIDYSEDIPYTLEKMDPVKAIDETGKNILSTLAQEDGIFLEQPYIGNSATISFRPSKNTDPSLLETFVLETKGYYEHIRDFTNPPDLPFISQFRNPGAFPKYGRSIYGRIKDLSLKGIAKSE